MRYFGTTILFLLFSCAACHAMNHPTLPSIQSTSHTIDNDDDEHPIIPDSDGDNDGDTPPAVAQSDPEDAQLLPSFRALLQIAEIHLPHDDDVQQTMPKLYQCPECQKNFTSPSGLRLHKATKHTPLEEQILYVCDVCGRPFHQMGHLNTHRKTHNPERQHICQECGKAYARYADLIGHIDRDHRNLAHYYTCPECGYSFTRKSNLETHMRTHTGEKPYECEGCKARFARSDTCKLHMKTCIFVKTAAALYRVAKKELP